MKRVVGIGACVLDTVVCCREFPREDGKSAAEDVLVTGGGPVANALVACARLGMHASYAGVLSDDASGAFLQEDFVRCGVATDLIKRAAGRAFTSYILLSRSSGTRTVVFDRGTLKGPSPEQCRAAAERADILHLDGNFLESALCAAAYARERGVKVCGFMAMLPLSDDSVLLARLADEMRALYDRARAHDGDIRHLSMGMSGDWELCLAHGANMIRLGTAIFGSRESLSKGSDLRRDS